MSITGSLYENFKNVPTRIGRGGSYPYIRWQDVADRMNQVFGVNWSSEVLKQEIIGDNVIVRVRVTINVEGVLSFQEGFGGAPNDPRIEAGNPFKSAYSKALKDACKKWGVGLFIDEEEEMAHTGSNKSAIPAGYAGVERGVPPTTTKTIGLPTPPATSLPKPIETPAPVVEKIAIPESNTTPKAPPVGMMGAKTMSLPPGVEMQNKKPVEPAPVTHIMPVVPAMSKVPPISMGMDMMSDVQKAALQSLLSIKGTEYEVLAKEALSAAGMDMQDLPEQDKLTYQQALVLIKYGNDKFRNKR